MSDAKVTRDEWCGESLAGHEQGLCHCKDIIALRSQRDALAEAMRDMFAMMEEGLLIRDISKDGDYGDSDWGMRMLQFTRRLAAANSALAAVTSPRRRSE